MLASPGLAQEGLCDVAILEAEKRLMEASADPEAWLVLAESHRCAENFHSALAAYERALSVGAVHARVAERVESLSQARTEAYFRVPPPQPCIGSEAVSKVIQGASEDLQDCFAEVDPSREEEMRLAFDVVAGGAVANFKVQGKKLEAEEGSEPEVFLACVEDKILSLSFPVGSGKDPVPVSCPLRLRPAVDSIEPAEVPGAHPP